MHTSHCGASEGEATRRALGSRSELSLLHSTAFCSQGDGSKRTSSSFPSLLLKLLPFDLFHPQPYNLLLFICTTSTLKIAIMDGRQVAHTVQNDGNMQYYASSGQPSSALPHAPPPSAPPQYPMVHRAAHPPPTFPNLQPALHLSTQQIVGALNGRPVAAMNGPLPAGAPMAMVPAPHFYQENYTQLPPNMQVVQHPLAVMQQVEVPFDPSTPPPFPDRAELQVPRRHGVLKITNVSVSSYRSHNSCGISFSQ